MSVSDGTTDAPRTSGDPEQRGQAESEAAHLESTPSKTEGRGLYRLLVDSVQDYAIFALDPDGVIVSWNEGARRGSHRYHQFADFGPGDGVRGR